MAWIFKKDIFILLICTICFISCVEKYPLYRGNELVISQSTVTRAAVNGCEVSYTISTTGVPNSSAINGWIRGGFSSFAQVGTYLQFTERSSGSTIINVIFREQDALPYSTTKGVLSFRNYTLGALEGNTLTLNRDYAWTEATIRKAVMYHIGLFLGMTPNQQDSASIMSSLLATASPSTTFTTSDIANFKSLYPAAIPITLTGKSAIVNPRGTLFTVNFQNTRKLIIRDFGINWSDDFGFTASGFRTLNTATEAISQTFQVLSLQPNRTYTCRAYVQTDCQTIYGTPFTIRTPSSGSWNNLGNLPFSERKGSKVITTAEIWGNAFIIGGELSNGQLTNEMWQFSAQTNTWQIRKSFPGTVRIGAVGFAIGNKLYYGLGNASNVPSTQFRDWWEYDISTDQWTQKKSYSGSLRSDGFAFSYQGGGYLTLGTTWTQTGNSYIGSTNRNTYRYEPTNDSWSLINDFPNSFTNAVGSFQLREFGYVLFNNRQLWRLDLQSSSWVRMTDFPTDVITNQSFARQTALGVSGGIADAASISNLGFYGISSIVNTSGTPQYSKQWWQYSFANTWVGLPNSGISDRHEALSFSLGEKIYVLGGVRWNQGGGSVAYLKDWWEYNP